MTEPKFEHDCERCRFLGRHTYDASYTDGSRPLVVDLYHCAGTFATFGGSVIARYGDDGHKYASIPVGMVQQLIDSGARATYSPALVEAHRRSQSPFPDLG